MLLSSFNPKYQHILNIVVYANHKIASKRERWLNVYDSFFVYSRVLYTGYSLVFTYDSSSNPG